MQPLTAADALDRYFLEARSKVLDVAAILDRIDRGGPAPNDPRLGKLQQALALLQTKGDVRAQRVQELFSLPYDAAWERPQPRGG
jgi:hypothetical protein